MRCKSTNKNGQPCSAFARAGSEFCYTHYPASAASREAARKLGGYHRQTPHKGDPTNVPGRIRTLEEVMALLDYALQEAVALENSVNRGRLLVAISGEYTAAIQATELEERVRRLEEAAHA